MQDGGSQGGHVPSRNLRMSMVGKEQAYLRTVISRFGTIIKVGHAVQIPPQTWETNEVDPRALSFRRRVPPECEIVRAGVPGYAGHLPNARPPHKDYTSLNSANSNHSKRHDRFAYDRSLQPTRMPVVGFSGHMRNTKESLECYGTSHWRPRAPTTKAAQQAAALEAAKKRAIDSHNPNLFKAMDKIAVDPLLQA